MSPTIALADETRAAIFEPNSKDRLLSNRSEAASAVPEHVLELGRVRFRSQQGTAAVQRTALLGVALARLDGVPFEAIGKILGVNPDRLVKMMHGDQSIPARLEERWTLVAEALGDLHAVVRPGATWRWFNIAVPALDNQTPFEVVQRGRGPVQLRELTRKYLDESFA